MTRSKGIDRKILRRMKYTSDQRGIMNRYLAEGDNWENHLEHTRNFIISCLEKNLPENVAIMGSGWLLDIPLEFMVDKIKNVYLVDIVHPPQIINKAEQYPNLHIVQADITGGAIVGAYNLVRQYQKSRVGSILDIACQATLAGTKTDFVISLNILNQLDILLVDYVSRFIEIPEDEKETFRARIQQQHLDLLPKGRSCLISDVEEKILNRDMQVVSTRPLTYAELPSGGNQEDWIWTFDTRGEYNKGHFTQMKVYAVQL